MHISYLNFIGGVRPPSLTRQTLTCSTTASSLRRKPATCQAIQSGAQQAKEQGWNILDHPQLYEAAFCATRNFEEEAALVYDLCDKNSEEAPSTFLDVGCGPGDHAIELTKLGCSVFAIDNSPYQLEHAKQKARDAGVSISFHDEDMREFSLPEGTPPLDAAIMLFDTMQNLHSIDDVQSCWSSINKCLKLGAIFLIELPHFEDIFNNEVMEPQFWETKIDNNGTTVIVEFGTEDDEFDPETQVLRRRICISTRHENEINIQGEQYALHRQYTFQELLCHAKQTGFAVINRYGELDSRVDVFDQEARRLVLVLQKVSDC